MKVLIIDDEPMVAELLALIIHNFYPETIIESYTEIKANIESIRKFDPNVIFLDINLKDESGFEFFNYFNKTDYKVVFVTAHSEYAIEAFKVRAYNYILKPVSEDEIKTILDEIKKTDLRSKEELLLRNLKNEIIKVKLSEILYIEADQYLSILYFKDNSKLITSKQLAKIQDELGENFYRLHKSIIVNLNHVISINYKTKQLIISNDVTLPIAKRRLSDLKDVIQKQYK